MPVNVILKGVSSNKQSHKQGKVNAKEICYYPIAGRVAALVPFIDKISITYKIDDADLTHAVVESLLVDGI